MTTLWTYSAWNPYGGHGGWAYVIHGEAVVGMAGGERDTTALRMGLTVAILALEASKDETVRLLYTPSRALAEGAAALPAWKAAGWRDDKDTAISDRDLWENLETLLEGSKTRVRPTAVPTPPRSQAGFTSAWADYALNKVKATGPFTAPIPKLNLLKFPV
jgi:ribonuclease HI